MSKKSKKTTLVKIILTKQPNGKWTCVRERKEGDGETATGLRDLEEVFDYLRAHEVKK